MPPSKPPDPTQEELHLLSDRAELLNLHHRTETPSQIRTARKLKLTRGEQQQIPQMHSWQPNSEFLDPLWGPLGATCHLTLKLPSSQRPLAGLSWSPSRWGPHPTPMTWFWRLKRSRGSETNTRMKQKSKETKILSLKKNSTCLESWSLTKPNQWATTRTWC